MDEWWRKYHNAPVPHNESERLKFWNNIAETAHNTAKQANEDCFFDAAGVALRDSRKAWVQVAEAAQKQSDQLYAEKAQKRIQRIDAEGTGALL